jgi:predicted nucleotidyltransferase
MPTAIPLPLGPLADFCRRWKIVRLEVFGSILREDFGPASDVDFLATWAPEAKLSLYDLVHAERELEALIGRRVDLLERPSIEQSPNWLMRRAILNGAQPVYAAA